MSTTSTLVTLIFFSNASSSIGAAGLYRSKSKLQTGDHLNNQITNIPRDLSSL